MRMLLLTVLAVFVSGVALGQTQRQPAPQQPSVPGKTVTQLLAEGYEVRGMFGYVVAILQKQTSAFLCTSELGRTSPSDAAARFAHTPCFQISGR